MRSGWYKESQRHSLAARGIKTNYYASKRRYNAAGAVLTGARALWPRALAYARGFSTGSKGVTAALRTQQALTASQRAAAATTAATASKAALAKTIAAAPKGTVTAVRAAGTSGTQLGRTLIGGKYSPIRIVRTYPKTSIGVAAYGAGSQRALRGVPGEGAVVGISDVIVPGPSPEDAAAAAALEEAGISGSPRGGFFDANLAKQLIGGAGALVAGAVLVGAAKKKSDEADQAAMYADAAAAQEAQLRAEEAALLAKADQLRLESAKLAQRQREAAAERRYAVTMDPAEEAEALAAMEDRRNLAVWNQARLDEAKLKQEVRELRASRLI